MLIDGYNIIFAWNDLKMLAAENLEAARAKLVERISAYKVFKNSEIIIVFDAYKVRGNPGEMEVVDGITVVYTKEAQTADAYIEKTAKELKAGEWDRLLGLFKQYSFRNKIFIYIKKQKIY